MPDLPPDLILEQAKAVADVYSEAVARLTQLVAKRLADGLDAPDWAEAKLAELGQLRDEARAVVDRLLVDGPDAIRAAVTDSAAAGVDAAALELPGVTLNPRTNTEAVDALVRETVAPIRKGEQTILRQVLDVYRQVIAETSAPGVVTGSETRVQAAQRALNRFVDRGVVQFVDKAGRRWELESYVEMATRTASGRAMIDGRLDVYRADGRDLVIVSDSPQECKLCRPFEGQLLSISGEHVGDKVDGRRVVDTVRGAQRKGLHHPNCRHDLRPYVPGLTKRYTSTADPTGDELRQEQRRLERGVRQWRRREAAALTPEAKRDAAAKARDWQRRLREHVDRHDLQRRPERERIAR